MNIYDFYKNILYKSIHIKNKLCKKDYFKNTHESILPFIKDVNFMCLEPADFLPDLQMDQISITSGLLFFVIFSWLLQLS